MSDNNEIYRLIRKIAGTFEREHLVMFVGEVVAVSNITMTCTIKDITGKSIAEADMLYSSYSDSELPNKNKELYNSIYGDETNAMYYTDVALMSGGNVDDGFVIYPKVGSQVTVLISDRQNAEIIKYTEVDLVQIISDETITSIDNTGLVVSTKNAKSLYRFQDENGGSSGQPGCYMSVNNDGTIYTQNESSFDLKVNNGSEIKLNTKISIKNQNEDLRILLKDILTALTTAACATPGSPLVFTPPNDPLTFITRLNTLMS